MGMSYCSSEKGGRSEVGKAMGAWQGNAEKTTELGYEAQGVYDKDPQQKMRPKPVRS